MQRHLRRILHPWANHVPYDHDDLRSNRVSDGTTDISSDGTTDGTTDIASN